jgi:hypothetical protein
MIILAENTELYELAAFAAASLHLLDEDLEVDIEIKPNLKDLMFGYMIGDEDEYKIRVASVDPVTVFHEMVHIDQYVKTRLVRNQDRAFWNGQEIPNSVPYLERPWEIEAEQLALTMADMWNAR